MGWVEINSQGIAFRRAGAASAPPLLLIHGVGAHAGWWDGVVRHLCERFQVVVPDLRGHGDSAAAGDGDYGPDAHARDLLGLVERMAIEMPLLLVGHSFGGVVALRMARALGARSRGVVLIETPPVYPVGPLPSSDDLARLPQLRYPSLAAAVRCYRPFPRRTFADRETLLDLARCSFRPAAEGDGAWISKTRPDAYTGLRAWDLRSALLDLEHPLLYLRGEASRIVPRRSLDFLRRSAVELGEIPRSAHHAPIDNPADLARRIRDFGLRDLRHIEGGQSRADGRCARRARAPR